MKRYKSGAQLQQFLPRDRALALDASVLGLFFGEPEFLAPFTLDGAAAVVDIYGPLVQHDGSCVDSYDSIVKRTRAAASEAKATAVVLRIDSPGGEALGMIECARELRAICEGYKKPLFAYVDGKACSAAFALASAATTIVVPPAGVVGSVGVFQALVDATAADRAMGLAVRLISSGERKLDGNPHTPMTDGALAATQQHVNGLAELFFGLVASMRPGKSAADIRALEGGIFLGAQAKNVGLADVVGSWTDVLNLIATAPSASSEKPMSEETKPEEDKKAKARKAFFSAMEAAFDSMFGDEPKKEEKKAEEPKKDEKASDKPEAEPDKDKPQKDEGSNAAAESNAMAFAALRQVQDLKAQLAAKDELVERESLLTKRPDFDDKMRASLAKMSIEQVREAVTTWPRVGPIKLRAIEAPQGTRGETQVSEAQTTDLDPEIVDKIKIKMGRKAFSPVASTYAGGVQELEYVSPEVAKARLEQIAKEGVK